MAYILWLCVAVNGNRISKLDHCRSVAAKFVDYYQLSAAAAPRAEENPRSQRWETTRTSSSLS